MVFLRFTVPGVCAHSLGLCMSFLLDQKGRKNQDDFKLAFPARTKKSSGASMQEEEQVPFVAVYGSAGNFCDDDIFIVRFDMGFVEVLDGFGEDGL